MTMTCELCGAENAAGLEECPRCGFVFRKEIRADMRDSAILKRHAGKSVDIVNRDLRNARTQLSAYLENLSARELSREELSSLLDDALALLRIPLFMGSEDELRLDEGEVDFLEQAMNALVAADLENGSPVGTPGTYVRLSNALQSMGRAGDAMAMIDKALLLDPRDRDATLSRAQLLFYAKDYARARKCLEKLLSGGEDQGARYLMELISQIEAG